MSAPTDVPPILVTVDEPASAGEAAPEPEQLFFIHGWPDDPSLWQQQVEYFVRKGYRCLRVTMPHYAGREDAAVAGDLESATGFFPDCDWGAVSLRLAEALREHCQGRRVTLVVHDWGSVWGFSLQMLAPELVKAVVAMDVGPWAMAGTWRNVPKMMGIGFAYQYWLSVAHILGRSSTSDFGKGLGDWMTRAFAGFAKKSLGDEANLTDAITSDGCYPYYYIHRNFLLELMGMQQPLGPGSDQPVPGGGGSPSCPCLFFWGSNKGFKFHDPSWERSLKAREDCHVVPVPAGHWLMTECPDIVNEEMDAWLSATLPNVPEAVGAQAFDLVYGNLSRDLMKASL